MWIEELPNGKYKYSERYIDPYTEKNRKVSITLNSKSNQAKKQANIELQEKIDKKIEEKNQIKITLGELLDAWWNQHKVSIRQSSQVNYEKLLKYIRKNINTAAVVRNTDTRFFQDFINELPQSYEYKKKFRSVLKMALDYAVDMEMIKINPINRAKVPKPALTKETYERVEDKYLEEEEINKLLNVYYSTFQSVHHGRLAEFMYLTGLRAGEAISLTIDDYDPNSQTIKVIGTLDYSDGYKNAKKEMPKTLASYREIDLSNRAIEILDELILENKLKFKCRTPYLFVGKTGKPIQINAFNNSLKTMNDKLGKDAIKKKMSSHIFRHSHISLLAELNIPVKAIMERVGHSDMETTMKIYTHVTKKTKASIVEKLNAKGK
ncbi:MAG: site-specific integrase [Enterococcus sp.]|uniref:tyrosine-type recombinase/integrase n=1 Tax=Enterococcus sp. TaxID=35783 RepID=UPI00264A06B4|nr:site-specific integrase [Enterococcus sp.]MDN6005146.1 site-specific integrase [Enterococcus sp.]MDN6218278.1 site-specific integrase [Enterococcus sp.]MDN6559964.1 site-specific integrase [Enterococcus sp.]MDN6585150.1 site-specific integrase [Enterococcus sp.]MDN6692487.1 site-specific integrase [Enterococcus sp.]